MIDCLKRDPDVGVIIGRFQVHQLHSGHRELIDKVVAKHRKVIILLGVSPIPCSPQNPLDFEARKKMIEKDYPSATILYVNDHPSDEYWSKTVDATIRTILGPMQDAAIYGSRDSFIVHYSGRFPVVELVATPGSITGTMERTEIGQYAGDSPEWRAGAIWASQQCYPTVYPVVDIAIFRKNGQELLLGRKPGETQWRLPGGFADPTTEGGFDQDALREAKEETGLDVHGLTYVCSAPIDDWRYRSGLHKIKTCLFYGFVSDNDVAVAADDLAEIAWFDRGFLPPLSGGSIAPFHRKLVERAIRELKK